MSDYQDYLRRCVNHNIDPITPEQWQELQDAIAEDEAMQEDER